MIINSLDLVLERADLQRLLAKVTGDVDKLKEIALSLENGVIVLSGKIAVGLTIPFTTKWKAHLLDNGNELALTLSSVSVAMMGMGEDMISGQIMSMLQSKLDGYDAVRIVEKDIVVDLNRVLQPRGIVLTAPIKEVGVSPAGIELKI